MPDQRFITLASGPDEMSSPLLAHMDARDDTHPRAEAVEPGLPGIELDSHGYSLRDLGEVTRRVVRPDDAEFRSGRRRDPLHPAGQHLSAESVDRQLRALADPDIPQLASL